MQECFISVTFKSGRSKVLKSTSIKSSLAMETSGMGTLSRTMSTLLFAVRGDNVPECEDRSRRFEYLWHAIDTANAYLHV